MDDIRHIAIMQPYFFPYIGYWQLVNLADKFVIYDDGNYIINGWINKNRILGQGGFTSQLISIDVSHASPNKKISEMERVIFPAKLRKIESSLEHRYRKAPFYQDSMEVIFPILENRETNLVRYLQFLLEEVSKYLGITTEFYLSSEVEKDGLEHVSDKVFRICNHFGCTNYVNPIGGQVFYDKHDWKERGGVNLQFIRRDDDISYRQFDYDFVPDLSIIDVMMFNSRDEIHDLLNRYTLL